MAMTTLKNEISINASVNKIWSILVDLELLEKYDPTVKSCRLISEEKSGMNAKRKVEMLDGKNWFEEKIVRFKPQEALVYQLTDCSFPIKSLKHSYSFHGVDDRTIVRQVMEYEVKYGIFGKLMDYLMIRKQSDSGIKIFFAGLKTFAEKN
jgi:ribosome-associated toxin RatA of RatAB toxin-antitoxin module